MISAELLVVSRELDKGDIVYDGYLMREERCGAFVFLCTLACGNFNSILQRRVRAFGLKLEGGKPNDTLRNISLFWKSNSFEI